MKRQSTVLILAALGGAAWLWAQTPANGPDPREIPVPRIGGPLGTMPGVNALPVREEMPDVMVFSDGTKVTRRAQWEKRRAEMKRILAYYAVGQAPPPPGNVKGKVMQSKQCSPTASSIAWCA